MKKHRSSPIRKMFIPVSILWLLILCFPRPESAWQDQNVAKQEDAQSSAIGPVRLYVSVEDENGQFFSTLNYYDFELYCDNAPQQISYFSKKDAPLGVVFVVDLSDPRDSFITTEFSGLNRVLYKKLIAEAPHFIENSHLMNEYSVVSLNQKAWMASLWTSNRDEIEKNLSTISVSVRLGEKSLLDPITKAIEQAKGSAHPKRAVILLSDGVATVTSAEMTQLSSLLSGNNISLYSIAFNPEFFSLKNHFAGGSTLRKVASKQLFTNLTAMTGGASYFPLNQGELVGSFEKIADELRHHYVLGFQPACHHKESVPHRIQIKLTPQSSHATASRRISIRYQEAYRPSLALNKK